jgi:hypothetical protein
MTSGRYRLVVGKLPDLNRSLQCEAKKQTGTGSSAIQDGKSSRLPVVRPRSNESWKIIHPYTATYRLKMIKMPIVAIPTTR